MISKKLYPWWSETFKWFMPSGTNPNNKDETSNGAHAIAGFLSAEIQYSTHSIDIWVSNLTNMEYSIAPDGRFGVGNAFWVLVNGDYVFIGTEYSKEQQVLMTRSQVLYVLEQYRAFLEGNYKDSENPPAIIDVEFVAEGQDAINQFDNLPNSCGVPYAD